MRVKRSDEWRREQVRPTLGFVVGLRWASWEMALRLSPSGWAWTGRSAQTSAGNEAETENGGQSETQDL